MEIQTDVFVTKEIAQKLKEIGFSEPCIVSYHYSQDKFYIDFEKMINSKCIEFKDIDLSDFNNWDYMLSIPAYEQVFNWFRDKDLDGSLFTENGYYYYRGSKGDRFLFSGTEETYEEAREQLILKLIEIYKDGCKK